MLRRLLDDAVGRLNRLHRLLVAHRVANADGRRLRVLRGQGDFFLEAVLVALVERIGFGRLRRHQPGHLVDDVQFVEQLEPFVSGADVAQVAHRQNDPIRHLPIKLAHNFDAHRLLPFDAQAVHRVGQVDAVVLGQLLDDAHTAVKIGVQRKDVRAVGDGLDELGGAHLVLRQKDDGRDARRRRVSRQRRAGVPGAGAGDGLDRVVGQRHHLLNHADEDGHAQIFEAAGVAVAAQLDPQVGQANLLAQSLGPEQVGVALKHADDVVVGQVGDEPLFHGPDAAAVGPLAAAGALVEQGLPLLGAALAQGLQRVVDLQQAAAGGAGVDDIVNRIAAGAAPETAKSCLVVHVLDFTLFDWIAPQEKEGNNNL